MAQGQKQSRFVAWSFPEAPEEKQEDRIHRIEGID
jgi:23S rRNA A1618 N6-methylase RlmF